MSKTIIKTEKAQLTNNILFNQTTVILNTEEEKIEEKKQYLTMFFSWIDQKSFINTEEGTQTNQGGIVWISRRRKEKKMLK